MVMLKPMIDFNNAIQSASHCAGFRMDDYWVWGGSVVKGEDARYHMFASRWPRSASFHPSWLIYSEIVRASSDTPAGPYFFEEVVLPARGPEWWDGDTTHNPTITYHAGTYILFYTGMRSPLSRAAPEDSSLNSEELPIVARSNKRIGIAISKSIFGPWKRLDHPILPTRPGTYYSFFTSNAAPVIHADGSVLLMFKSRQYDGRKHSNMMIGVARADHWSGPYEVVTQEPVFGGNGQHVIEDPCLWQSENGYEMIAKDMTGEIAGERHAGIYAWSADGEQWHLYDPPKSWSRRILWDDGTQKVMGSCERPYVLFEDGYPTYLFMAMGDGPGGFTKANDTWNQAIPLDTCKS